MEANKCREDGTMMYLDFVANLIIENSRFSHHTLIQIENNERLDNGFAGIRCYKVRFSTLKNCIFNDNKIYGGGGIYKQFI